VSSFSQNKHELDTASAVLLNSGLDAVRVHQPNDRFRHHLSFRQRQSTAALFFGHYPCVEATGDPLFNSTGICPTGTVRDTPRCKSFESMHWLVIEPRHAARLLTDSSGRGQHRAEGPRPHGDKQAPGGGRDARRLDTSSGKQQQAFAPRDGGRAESLDRASAAVL
jgi:hypothetical protein